MKLKTLIATSVVGIFTWSGAQAFSAAEAVEPTLATPATVSEVPASLSTMNSPDWRTGGYQGWGPVPNPMTPIDVSESKPTEFFQRMQERAEHMAEVREAQDAVWEVNVTLRASTELSTPPTRTASSRILQFFWR
jgi:hypothetical protein